MTDTQHEAAIEAAYRAIHERVTASEPPTSYDLAVDACAAYDAARSGEREDALDAGVHHGDDISDLWRPEVLGRAARSGEAEGGARRALIDIKRDTADPRWLTRSQLHARIDAVLAEHSEPRQAKGYSDTDVMRIIAFALRLGWTEGHKGEAIDHILQRQNEVIDGALRAEPRQDQPAAQERETTCGCGHFLHGHGPRGCGECGCPLRPAEVVELLEETGRRAPAVPPQDQPVDRASGQQAERIDRIDKLALKVAAERVLRSARNWHAHGPEAEAERALTLDGLATALGADSKYGWRAVSEHPETGEREAQPADFHRAFEAAEEAGFFADHEDIDGNEAALRSVLDAAFPKGGRRAK